jgi:hypothetical protein
MPYLRNPADADSHNYVDLRASPDLIVELPELRNRPALRRAVEVLNDGAGQFRTIGVAEWQQETGIADRPTGLLTYVHFCFDAPQMFAEPVPLYQLFHTYSAHVNALPPEIHRDVYSEFELSPAEFRDRDCCGWSATLWLQCSAPTLQEARDRQDVDLTTFTDFIAGHHRSPG